MDKAGEANPPKHLVLICDDDTAVRNSLKFALELEGFEVRSYSGPGNLLNEDKLPDSSCLVVNYQMPEMNGLELVARLRDRRSSIPVILVTGHSNENLRKRAAAVGVTMVEKPFLGNRLIECLRRAFDGKASTE
jgi:two-component system response regulator FixJ